MAVCGVALPSGPFTGGERTVTWGLSITICCDRWSWGGVAHQQRSTIQHPSTLKLWPSGLPQRSAASETEAPATARCGSHRTGAGTRYAGMVNHRATPGHGGPEPTWWGFAAIVLVMAALSALMIFAISR